MRKLRKSDVAKQAGMKTPNAWRNLFPAITTRNLLILSVVISLISLVLQNDVGFNIADEGFLWYGTIRAGLGDVPVRDFQAYDPGRYYFGALWFKILHNDGILALRFSQTIFQFLGLTTALFLLRRVLNSWITLIAGAMILLKWMFPIWKIYEPVILILAIYFAVRIIEKPSRGRYFVAGVFIGLFAFFGRNHGLYCSAGFLLLTLFSWWKIDKRALPQRLAALALGTIIGYLPMWCMLACIPGFYGSFLETVVYNVRHGTNLHIPVPWPWLQSYGGVGLREATNRLTIGLLYVGFPCFYILAFASLLWKTKAQPHPILIASAFIGAPYLHYTFDRPHLYYLAWTIPPIILGLIAVPASFSRQHRLKISVGVWCILALFTLCATGLSEENYLLVKAKSLVKAKLLRRSGGDFANAMYNYGLTKTDIRGDNLWATTDTAETVNNAKALQLQFIPTNEEILIAPYLPGLYPIYGRRSPVWEIYFLLPQPPSKEEKMVEDLERNRVNWALVCHYYMDNRPELAFEHTHPYVWDYLNKNFQRVLPDQSAPLQHECELLKRNTPESSSLTR